MDRQINEGKNIQFIQVYISGKEELPKRIKSKVYKSGSIMHSSERKIIFKSYSAVSSTYGNSLAGAL